MDVDQAKLGRQIVRLELLAEFLESRSNGMSVIACQSVGEQVLEIRNAIVDATGVVRP